MCNCRVWTGWNSHAALGRARNGGPSSLSRLRRWTRLMRSVKSWKPGCDGYIAKPVDASTLRNRIRAHLVSVHGRAELLSKEEGVIATLREEFLRTGAD